MALRENITPCAHTVGGEMVKLSGVYLWMCFIIVTFSEYWTLLL